jgi:hypothetical protein
LKKKKQENFFKLGRAGFNATVPAKQKFFAPLFCKKAAACPSPLRLPALGLAPQNWQLSH